MTIIILGLIVLLVGFFSGRNTPLGRFKSLVILAGVIITIVGFLTASLRQIDAGHVGVQVLFGQVQEGILYEGLNIVNPLVDVKQLSIQTQNYICREHPVRARELVMMLSESSARMVLRL